MAQKEVIEPSKDSTYEIFTPQSAPGRNCRIGMIALASDPATEPEWRSMIPDDDIALYVSRIPYASNCTPDDLRAMEDNLTQSASLIDPELDPDVIAYSCTAGTVNIGFHNVVNRIRLAHPNIPVSTPISGAIEGFNCLNASNIGVVTPYPHDVNETIKDYLIKERIKLTGLKGFGMTSDHAIATIPVNDLATAAEKVITQYTEVLFFSCTALIIVNHIKMLEQMFSLPVVTSNQAMLWQALRLAGYKKPINGFGRLMTV